MPRARALLSSLLPVILLSACAALKQGAKLMQSDTKRLREPHPEVLRAERAQLLILAIDGVDRELLYSLLRRHRLPQMEKLLGGEGNAFPHAYFEPHLVATLPSITAAGWASVFTGKPPGESGITGNEFFIRKTRQFAAPIPNSVNSVATALSVFTEGYANKLLTVPTVYERMLQADSRARVWVSMSQYFKGADLLLLTRRAVLGDAFAAFASKILGGKVPRKLWEDLDQEDLEVVEERLSKEDPPDVLTVYLFGSDNYAHTAEEGPDRARTGYLEEVIDPAIGKLSEALDKKGALASRYVLVTGDHGHTQVVYDDAHALSDDDKEDPPAVVKQAGYRLRPFDIDVDEKNDFQAVLAYEGALAFVYVADRSSCPKAGDVCNWTRSPRYEEDVVPLAQAFADNNESGRYAPSMKGTLDMILVRPPRSKAQQNDPFEVYVGRGKSVGISAYLESHPHPTYVELEARLRDLALGPAGDRAGDLLLLAHNGDREQPEERYYFAPKYHSWHGSPSHRDSDIPLIVSNRAKTAGWIEHRVGGVLGASPRQQKVGEVILDLWGVAAR